jgi:hypothetical protein
LSERPIIFSAPMVRALLEGRKTQTRRVWTEKRPYGEIGDRVWVKEAWHAPRGLDRLRPGELPPGTRITYVADGDGSDAGKKRSVLFMPRWASRLTLELVDVRVESLQEISDADARAEGVANRDAYHKLWDSINSARGFGWETNPRVWVVEFTRLPR